MNRTLLPLVTLSLFLGGCTGITPNIAPPASSMQSRVDGFPIDDAAWAKLGYRRDWTGFPFVSGGATLTFVRPASDLIAVQESGSTVSILDAQNGRVRWSNTIAGPLTRYVDLVRYQDPVRGDVVLACSDSDIRILNAQTGNLITTQNLERVASSAPVFADDMASFGSPAGEYFGHNVSRGFREWGFGTGNSIDTQPILVGGVVGMVTQNGSVVFLDPYGGGAQSRARLFAGLSVNPVTDGASMIVASLDQSIYAISPSANIVWQYRTSAQINVQPSCMQGRVYATITDGNNDSGLICLDSATGKKLWFAKGISGTVFASRAGSLLVRTTDGVVTLDAKRGDLLERIALPGVHTITPDASADGNLYVASKTGLIVKFVPKQ
ncbi:MAG: PQQ-binding-like beta-propeller repeat protein [Planctomycetes bacterium]|nr:PQQ-binding-like beta-propeller repeat protein [Planctomycetota bacterium]